MSDLNFNVAMDAAYLDNQSFQLGIDTMSEAIINIEMLKAQIVELLKPLEPEKVILFGSYAWGLPTEDSDLDVYVVTNDNFIPQNFREKTAVERSLNKLPATSPPSPLSIAGEGEFG